MEKSACSWLSSCEEWRHVLLLHPYSPEKHKRVDGHIQMIISIHSFFLLITTTFRVKSLFQTLSSLNSYMEEAAGACWGEAQRRQQGSQAALGHSLPRLTSHWDRGSFSLARNKELSSRALSAHCWQAWASLQYHFHHYTSDLTQKSTKLPLNPLLSMLIHAYAFNSRTQTHWVAYSSG